MAGHPAGPDVEAEKSQGAEGRWGLGPWLTEWGDGCRALGEVTPEQDWLESFTGEMGRGSSRTGQRGRGGHSGSGREGTVGGEAPGPAGTMSPITPED